MRNGDEIKQRNKKGLRQFIWGLIFATPFTIWAIWDTYQIYIYPMDNIMPSAPNVDYEVLYDFKTGQWVPLRKEKQAKSINEKAIEKAKTINFDNAQYDPELDPLFDTETNH